MEKKIKKKTQSKPAVKKGVKSPPLKTGSGNNAPFFVLVIIILVTVIVLLLDKYYEKGKFVIPYLQKTAEKSDSARDKNDTVKDKKNEIKVPAETDKLKVSDEKVNQPDEKKAEEQPAADRDVLVYFLKLDEKSEKIYLSTVKRKVSERQFLSLAIDQLIKGPTPKEEDRGYITAVPSNLRIRSVNIRGKTAEIDFNGAIEEGATGDILLKRMKQIVHTATQFENIDNVQILINGQKRKTIGGDGLSIGGPIGR